MKSQAFFTETLASVVVFLVALPLCMGIAIASGAPPAAGLLSGMIGGLVVGWLAGSPLQVSGPAAGLAVIVFDIIHTHGIEALGPILAIAGILQMVAGKLKLGQWFRAVAPAVLRHRLVTNFNAEAEGVSTDDVIRRLLESVPAEPPKGA